MSLSLNIIHLPDLPKILSDTFILLWSCFRPWDDAAGRHLELRPKRRTLSPGPSCPGATRVPRNPRNRSSKTWATWNHPVCCGDVSPPNTLRRSFGYRFWDPITSSHSVFGSLWGLTSGKQIGWMCPKTFTFLHEPYRKLLLKKRLFILYASTHHTVWWMKSCTSWCSRYPRNTRVLYIPRGAGFLPSTVLLHTTPGVWGHQGAKEGHSFHPSGLGQSLLDDPKP